METHVFFRGKPPTKAALARALRELEFPFTIPNAKGSLAQQHGFMPMKLRREDTGVEFDLYDRIRRSRNLPRTASIRAMSGWRASAGAVTREEAAAGLCGAAALAKLTNGVVFDEAEGKLLSASEAIAVARQFLETLPKPAPRQPGTRPADIKRYLKPLLELRSDLVLRGRFLIIRPVRHILRGAVLDRTSDKYRFNIWRYIAPLYSASWDRVGLGTDRYGINYETWQPHFLPVLFGSLAEDVFDYVGQITSLAGLAQNLETIGRHPHARVEAFLLSGQPGRAAECVADEERKSDNTQQMRLYLGKLRELLDRDIASICAEYHVKEAEAVRTMTLGDIWEPSPFPVELPEIEREATSSEPIFVTTPWVGRSPSLVQETPDRPGEVRFGTMAHHRKDRLVLLLPLSHEEAERKHRNREHYVLSARLPRGQLAVLIYRTYWSPHDPHQPKNPDYVPPRALHLWVYGASALLLADFHARVDTPDTLEFWSVNIRTNDNSRHCWLSYNDLRDGQKTIYDHRVDPRAYENLSDHGIGHCSFSI